MSDKLTDDEKSGLSPEELAAINGDDDTPPGGARLDAVMVVY